LATACAAVSSVEHCAALYEALSRYTPYYSVDTSLHVDGAVVFFLGKLAAALGRIGDARTNYEIALERHEAFQLVPCAVQTQISLARLLHAPGVRDLARARALLNRAHATAAACGMGPLARAALTELERC
jgi:hypothetical protein